MKLHVYLCIFSVAKRIYVQIPGLIGRISPHLNLLYTLACNYHNHQYAGKDHQPSV